VHELASSALFEEQVAPLGGRLLSERNWTVVTARYPLLDVRFEGAGRVPMRVRMGCQGWNDQPPSVILLDADGKSLTSAPAGSNIFHQGPHDTTKLPFVCMAGTLEYHTHPSHVGDHWDSYRNRSAYSLGEILTQIWNGWLKCKP